MCGIFGVYSERKIPLVPILHDGLLMLNHRGQEGTGVILSDKEHPLRDFHERRISRAGGSVRHFFSKFDHVGGEFYLGMGQNRYSTAGSVDILENLQPMLTHTQKFGWVSLVHNGNIPHAKKLKEEMSGDFSSDSDTEIILKLIAHSKRNDIESAVIESLEKVEGAYSVIIMTENQMIAARDPYGFRPLSLAVFDDGFMVSSETCAFDAIYRQYNVEYLRDIEPGEVVVIDQFGVKSLKPFEKKPTRQCIFELIYFARPDSFVFGKSAAEFRIETGKEFAKIFPMDIDGVVSIPDSANYFGDGHAFEQRVPHLRAIVRNHYVGRTFINPDQLVRNKNIRTKLNPIKMMLERKRLSVDDDSIVRGNTSRKISRMIRNCKPKSIAFSVSCPPIISHCPYGIDIKGKEELIAADRDIASIRGFIEVDELNYLPIETLKNLGGENFCYGCFNESYAL